MNYVKVQLRNFERIILADTTDPRDEFSEKSREFDQHGIVPRVLFFVSFWFGKLALWFPRHSRRTRLANDSTRLDYRNNDRQSKERLESTTISRWWDSALRQCMCIISRDIDRSIDRSAPKRNGPSRRAGRRRGQAVRFDYLNYIRSITRLSDYKSIARFVRRAGAFDILGERCDFPHEKIYS